MHNIIMAQCINIFVPEQEYLKTCPYSRKLPISRLIELMNKLYVDRRFMKLFLNNQFGSFKAAMVAII